MKVLITGANGFVGSFVSRYLMAQGIACVALDVKGAPEGGDYAARYTWDDLDTLDLSPFDGVIHLAGKAHDTQNTSDPQSYFDINVGLTRRILSALVHECDSALVERPDDRGQTTNELMNYRTNALKFIFFSSVKACADTVEGVLTEACVPNPQTPYGQSKLEAEGVVRSALVHYCVSALVEERGKKQEERGVRSALVHYCDSALVGEAEVGSQRSEDSHLRQGYGGQGGQITNELMNYRTNALSYYILRPAMIMGPGNKGNMKLLTQVVKAGIPWPLGAFENKRSFASIENVARVVEALLTKDVETGIYQVADDEPLSTNQLIEQIAASLGKKPRIWRLPRGLMRGIARIGDFLHLPLNSERLKKLTESYVVSNAKLARALGHYCDHSATFAKASTFAKATADGTAARVVAKECYCDHTVVTME